MLIRYDDNNQPYQSPPTRLIENECTPSPCVIATTTTSCIDRYKTKTKQEIPQIFLTLGSLNDMTNTRDRNKLQKKGSKDWQPLHIYIQRNKNFKTSMKPDY